MWCCSTTLSSARMDTMLSRGDRYPHSWALSTPHLHHTGLVLLSSITQSERLEGRNQEIFPATIFLQLSPSCILSLLVNLWRWLHYIPTTQHHHFVGVIVLWPVNRPVNTHLESSQAQPHTLLFFSLNVLSIRDEIWIIFPLLEWWLKRRAWTDHSTGLHWPQSLPT